MYEREITITNPTGLHARPATLLVQKAGKYESKLKLIKENVIANPKSIFYSTGSRSWCWYCDKNTGGRF